MKLELAPTLVLIISALVSAYLFIGNNKQDFSTNTTQTTLTETKQEEKELFADQTKLEEYINDYRKSSQLPKLEHNEYLCEVASKRLPQLRVEFSHNNFWKMEKDFSYFTGISENIAVANIGTDTMLIFNSWRGSPAHNKAILDPAFTHTCVKCDNYNCVQLFGSK